MSKGAQVTVRAGTKSQLGTYCSSFRASPSVPQSLNHSWVAPLLAPAPPDPVTQPSEYKFASRAPVVRRSPAAKHSRAKTAHQSQLPAATSNGKTSTSSSSHQRLVRAAPEQLDPNVMRYYDSGNRYDEFLASFQHRIDGMTGQRGGWGF